METLLGISYEQARVYLDSARAGVWVHPVVLTASLCLTGDVELKNLGETYERFVSETDGSVV